jgi:hypothetical protein
MGCAAVSDAGPASCAGTDPANELFKRIEAIEAAQKAGEQRTTALEKENAVLRSELAAVQKENAALTKSADGANAAFAKTIADLERALKAVTARAKQTADDRCAEGFGG